jgi:hypothetical protein
VRLRPLRPTHLYPKFTHDDPSEVWFGYMCNGRTLRAFNRNGSQTGKQPVKCVVHDPAPICHDTRLSSRGLSTKQVADSVSGKSRIVVSPEASPRHPRIRRVRRHCLVMRAGDLDH